jgi:hypothetical protein
VEVDCERMTLNRKLSAFDHEACAELLGEAAQIFQISNDENYKFGWLRG